MVKLGEAITQTQIRDQLKPVADVLAEYAVPHWQVKIHGNRLKGHYIIGNDGQKIPVKKDGDRWTEKHKPHGKSRFRNVA